MPDRDSPDSDAPDVPANLALEYERLSLSFRALGGGLWDYDLSADVLYCNDRWYEILGRDPVADRITTIGQFKPWIHPDDIALVTQVDPARAALLRHRGDSYRVEFRIVRPDGAVRWLRSAACMIIDRTSRHVRAIGCVTDITEFRAAAPPPSHLDAAVERMRTRDRTADVSGAAEAHSPLTDKERNCLVWVCGGKSAWETATILGVSQRTVEFHLNNATRKLDASNKIHAAFIAVRRGLLDLPQ